MFPVALYLAWRCGEDVYEIQKVEDGRVVELLEFLYAIYNHHVNNWVSFLSQACLLA